MKYLEQVDCIYIEGSRKFVLPAQVAVACEDPQCSCKLRLEPHLYTVAETSRYKILWGKLHISRRFSEEQLVRTLHRLQPETDKQFTTVC